MNNIKELIKDLKSEDFIASAKESYYFLTSEKEENKVSFEEYISALRGLFIDKFITAISEEGINYIMNAAQNSDIFAVDANGIFKLVEATKAKIGDLVEKDYLKKIRDITDYQDEPLYDDLSKYNNVIVKYIKDIHFYYSIRQIKMGNYKAEANYRLSQKEIRMITNVRMIGPINRIIHANYDINDFLWPCCDFDEIPEDSVLKRFAFHTDKENPLFKIVFEDGTIVEYLYGDLRVLSYKFQSLLTLIKLNIVKILEENKIYDVEFLEKEDLIKVLVHATNIAQATLNTLTEVYTRKMIDDSKKELEDIKELVKEYNL